MSEKSVLKWGVLSVFWIASANASVPQLRDIDIAQRAMERRALQSEVRPVSRVHGLRGFNAQQEGSSRAKKWQKGQTWTAKYYRFELNEQVEPYSRENRILNASGLSFDSVSTQDPELNETGLQDRLLGLTELEYECLHSTSDLAVIRVQVRHSTDPLWSAHSNESIHLVMDPVTFEVRRKLWVDAAGTARELSPSGLLLKRSALEFLRVDFPHLGSSRDVLVTELDPKLVTGLKKYGGDGVNFSRGSLFESIDPLGRPVDYQWDSEREGHPHWVKGMGYLLVFERSEIGGGK